MVQQVSDVNVPLNPQMHANYGCASQDRDNDDDDSLSNLSSNSCMSKGSTTRKLSKIEKKIQNANLSKRERRLLQNRKSALKCRLKKQDQLYRLKNQVERLSNENRSLKEKVRAISFPFLNKLFICPLAILYIMIVSSLL